jgi:hypothetical protein
MRFTKYIPKQKKRSSISANYRYNSFDFFKKGRKRGDLISQSLACKTPGVAGGASFKRNEGNMDNKSGWIQLEM